ncbi:S1 family peptidase [Corynebacterium cystitidis]|uniref:S1 family peptidase n=1 Tax=Corynebacterium cystitidis TaxID=35757 RepID=UPI00211DF84C|nr:S1 family peptidase [Corynebacterium cystitidis]
MNRRQALVSLTTALALALPLLPGTAAPAAQGAPVGPGAPVRAYPEPGEDQDLPTEWEGYSCSQAFAGTVTLPDGSRKEVLVTAAHCVSPFGLNERVVNPAVYAPKTWGDQLIAYRDKAGEWVNRDDATVADLLQYKLNAPDWATAQLTPGTEMTNVSTSVDHYGHQRSAPVALTGVRDYPDLAPYEVSTDNFGQPICKDGQRSARTCGVQLFRASESVVHWGLWKTTSLHS